MTGRDILIVDDDLELCEMVTILLAADGHTVTCASTGREGLARIEAQPPDLVILDVNLPDMMGFDLLRELRRTSNVPVLMLTGRAEERDVVAGLDRGADDYLTKPFRPDELSARVRALLRRVPASDQTIKLAGNSVTIDPRMRTVRVRDQPVELTPTEYQLLLLMAQSPGEVFRHQALLSQVWGEEYVNDTAYLKVYIWHLRRKLEENPREPKIVLTDWGVGYRLAP